MPRKFMISDKYHFQPMPNLRLSLALNPQSRKRKTIRSLYLPTSQSIFYPE